MAGSRFYIFTVRPLVLGALVCLGVGKSVGGVHAGEESTKEHWAFQAVQRSIPPLDPSGWASHPVDRFIVARLQEKGLAPNAPADRRTLIRRAYLDLIGIPPSPSQVEEFLADDRPGAFRRVVDELLASPLYGERWGRHWLDLARYADTSGDAADAPVPEAHLYRDYVIQAFNNDLPYNEFIIEQIAGDLLAKKEPGDRTRIRQIATGYIALARRFGNAPYADMHLVIENTIDTIGKGMLGLTLACARCHDHKFDPITSQDYYGLYAYFSSTRYPHPSTEHERQRKNFVTLPNGDLAYAVVDKLEPEEIGDVKVHRKGQPRAKGELAKRGFIDVLNSGDAEIPENESGRLELARWIASEQNPLTARVMANRVWQYHFGRGIVETSSNFGRKGKQPTHPELLDWLAAEFIESGWSVKHLHRLMMLTKTYQLSSQPAEENMETDPGNEYYWRYGRHRMSAEALRDSVLFVSGRLRWGNPGEHPFPKPDEEGKYPYTQHRPFLKDYDHEYRTVYLPSRRLGKHPYVEIFDGPNPNECTEKRSVSTVPLQSLFWMNSDFVQQNAEALASRVLEQGEDIAGRLEHVFQWVYARPPADEEASGLSAYVKERMTGDKGGDETQAERKAWTSLCRILLASNEFVYVE